MLSGDCNPRSPLLSELDWEHQYRIVSSEFPPINFFETLVEPDLISEEQNMVICVNRTIGGHPKCSA